MTTTSMRLQPRVENADNRSTPAGMATASRTEVTVTAAHFVPTRAARSCSSSSSSSSPSGGVVTSSNHVSSSTVTLGCLCALLHSPRVEAWGGGGRASTHAVHRQGWGRQSGVEVGQARQLPSSLQREVVSSRWSGTGDDVVVCRSSVDDYDYDPDIFARGRPRSSRRSGRSSRTATMSVLIGSDSGTLKGPSAPSAPIGSGAGAGAGAVSEVPDGAGKTSKPSVSSFAAEASSERLVANSNGDQNGHVEVELSSSVNVEVSSPPHQAAVVETSKAPSATRATKERVKLPEKQMKDLGKQGRWQEALNVLQRIDCPTENQYVSAIMACEVSRQPRQALRVHGLMVAAGMDSTPGNLLPVVRGLLRVGDPATALRVFQQSNFRVSGQNFRISEEKEQSGGKPGGKPQQHALQRLYFYAIRAAQKLGKWREAVVLYREAETVHPRPTAAAAATVFNACYKERQYATAVAFANAALEPPHEDEERRRVLMNKIIVSCGRAGPDHYRQALEVYRQLEQTIGPDGYTLTATIDVLRRLCDWRTAVPLLEQLAYSGVGPEDGLRTSFNAVLSAMGADHFEEAKELSRRARDEWGVRGDTVTYGTLILAASEQELSPMGQAPPAEETSPSQHPTLPLGQMQTRMTLTEVYARRAGANGSLGGFGGGGGREEGQGARVERQWPTVGVLRLAKAAEMVPSEACLNMVMFNLARSGAWAEATALVDAIASMGMRVSRNQQEALVSALCIGEQWEDAVSAIETMLCESIVVDEITATLAVKAFAAMGIEEYWREALTLLKQATRAAARHTDQTRSRDYDRSLFSSGVTPEPSALGVTPWHRLLSNLAGEGLREAAIVVLQEMGMLGIPIDEEIGTTLVKAAYKVGDFTGVIAWLDRLRHAGLRLSPRGYIVCIDACRELGNPEAARRILDAMIRDSVQPTTAVYNAVLGALCFSFPIPRGFYDRRREEQQQAKSDSGKAEGPTRAQSIALGRSSDRRRAFGDDDVDVNGGDGEVVAKSLPEGVEVELVVDGALEGVVEEVDGGQKGGWGQQHPHPKSVAWADEASVLLADMESQDVRPDALTYGLVVAALLAAEREDEVVSLWRRVWREPRASILRRSVAKHVLGTCKDQGRGRLAVQLLQLGARLSDGKSGVWPEQRSYTMALSACEREGETAWPAVVSLVDAWKAGEHQRGDGFPEQADAVLQKAASNGSSSAVEARSELSRRLEEEQS